MERPIPDHKRKYTLEEYFALNDVSDVKYEYWDGYLIPHGGWETDKNGQIVGMEGGTDVHSDIASNLIREVGNGLKGRPSKVSGSDLQVRSPRSGRYHYPDLSITCGPRAYYPPDRRTTITNPQVIIEVLSPSTEKVDRGEKFREYITIESLKEYLLVSQDQPRVEMFFRGDDGQWIVGQWAEGLEASVTFGSLGLTLPLAEIYAGVEFSV